LVFVDTCLLVYKCRGAVEEKDARMLKGHEMEDSISHERLYYRIGEVSRLTVSNPMSFVIGSRNSKSSDPTRGVLTTALPEERPGPYSEDQETPV